MDANLVDKITRLVLANLEDYNNSQTMKENSINKVNYQYLSVNEGPSYHPLSSVEVDEWKAISRKIGNRMNEGNPYVKPLNEEELQTWQSISSKIHYTRKDNLHEPIQERVKFFPHY